MTPEQQSAFIIAQAAMLNAEIATMQAENLHRASRGEATAYTEEVFQATTDKYSCLTHNAVLSLFGSG